MIYRDLTPISTSFWRKEGDSKGEALAGLPLEINACNPATPGPWEPGQICRKGWQRQSAGRCFPEVSETHFGKPRETTKNDGSKIRRFVIPASAALGRKEGELNLSDNLQYINTLLFPLNRNTPNRPQHTCSYFPLNSPGYHKFTNIFRNLQLK